MAAVRRQTPSDPTEHQPGNVGMSSRWWYLPGMFKPLAYCESCTRPPMDQTPGARLTEALRSASSGAPVQRTSQLYRIPRIRTSDSDTEPWSSECVTWPRYSEDRFALHNTSGDSMLQLTDAEASSLTIVVLVTNVKKEVFGGSHQLNWKKVGLSRAYFRKELVCEANMPSPRAKAAYRFLMSHNEYYKKYQGMQQDLLSRQASLNISSYDLFILHTGIECAMFPVLYPTTAFSDTGILEHYRATNDDEANRTVSIGLSWTRKVLSSVRVYAEQRDLPFFLYEKNNAGKFFNAHVRAKRMGVTADVLTRDSQTSTGYWEVQKDASSDVVRIMLDRCFDEDQYPLLYKHCRNLRGELWLAAFPNVFITIAPAEC